MSGGMKVSSRLSAMLVPAALLLAAGPVLTSAPSEAADHYNLEEGLPVEVEDAVPTSFRNREIQGLVRWEHTGEGEEHFRLEPRLEAGIWLNAQATLAVPFDLGPGAEEKGLDEGLGDVRLGLLYNFNRESLAVPALALAGEAAFPTNDESEGVDTTLKAIATKTVGRSSLWHRVHVNASWTRNAGRKDDERRNLYKAALGYDLRITPDTLLVLDVVREREKEEGKDANIIEAGIRCQWTPLTVLAAGVGAGVGEDSPDFRVSLAFQHSF